MTSHTSQLLEKCASTNCQTACCAHSCQASLKQIALPSHTAELLVSQGSLRELVKRTLSCLR